jgi:Polyketide cyclase / dehydrase and lipid transport
MGRTIHVEESVEIGRTPAVVWERIADYGSDSEWRKGLVEMTPDPPGGLRTAPRCMRS